MNDVRYTLRSLTRTPVWTTTLVLTIALGIGSNASVQGFVRGLLTSDLPIYAIERVVTVFATDPRGTSGPVTFAMLRALQQRPDLFESLGAIRESQQRVTLSGRAALMAVAHYSRDTRSIFPLPTDNGVTLGPRARFANFPASVDPVGRAIEIDGTPMAIAGVMPYWLEGLYRGRVVDAWVPLDESSDVEPGPVWLIGRLRAGVTLAAAQTAVSEFVSREQSITVLPYTAQTPETTAGMLRVGALLRIAAIAVFAIACANVAAFVLTRSWSRARETAVRVAIGARRRQLFRQLLIDSAVISIVGGAAGLFVATWMADIVPLMFFDQDAERLVFLPDARAIAITALTGVVVTVLCGLAPLFETSDEQPSAVLQREIAGPSTVMMRVSTALILLQMTACALLVIATGLLMQGVHAGLDTPAGRRLGNPVVVSIEALPSPSTDDGRTYFAAAHAAAASVTTISETVWAARLPGLRPAWQWVRFDRPSSARREITMPIAPLTPTALDAIQLPPLSGRLFSTYNEDCPAVVLSEAAAKSLFSDHAIGRVLEVATGQSLEVIGIARPKDIRAASDAIAYDHPSTRAPLGIDGSITFLASPPDALDSGLIDVNVVSPNYFDAMGLSLVAGELFVAPKRGCRTGVVNEEAATKYFGGDAIGGAVIDANGRRTEIVGVVRSALLTSAQRLPEPTLFVPASQDYVARMTMLLLATDSGSDVLDLIRQRITAVPGGRADRMVVATLDDHLSATALAPERIATTLVGTFSAIAIALGALGLYGLMADAARRRQREFAMRLALGAQSWRVVHLVIGQGLRLVMMGAGAGALASLLVARWLSTIVPAAGWPSLMVWVAAPAVLAAAVVIASVIPARRALSVDLVSLMRDM